MFADQRSHLRGTFEWWTQLDAPGLLCHGINELFVNRLLNQDTAAGGANFTLIYKYAEESAIDGGFKIRVGKKDVGRFSAKLERDSLNCISRLLHDDLAYPGTARKCDLIYIRMFD